MSDNNLSETKKEVYELSEVHGNFMKQVDEKEVIREFIGLYETLPELWDTTNKYYKDRSKKNLALDKLVDLYSKIKPDATREDVKKKINVLRSNYRKEVRKILESKRLSTGTDDVYQPNSWTYYSLQFLNRFEDPGVNLSADNIQEEIIEETSSLTWQHTPPKKRKNLSTLSKQRGLLSQAYSYLSKPEFQNYSLSLAKVWANKLDKLQSQQRLFAEKAINDVLFEGELGLLTRYSVKINEASSNVVEQSTGPITTESEVTYSYIDSIEGQ